LPNKNDNTNITNPAIINRTPPSNNGGVFSTTMRYFPVGKDDPIKSVVSNIEIKKIKFEPRFISFPFFQKILMIFFVFYSTLLKMNVKRFIKKFQDYFFKLLCIEKKTKKDYTGNCG